MPLFRRRREVPADVVDGFCAAEAPALQRSLLAALGRGERPAPAVVPARLEVARGAGDRLVLVWRNVVVGFVPGAARPGLAAQLDRAGDATLVARGAVHRTDGTWRVWVGDVPPDGFPPAPEGLDTLPPPQPTILGIPLRGLDDPA